ncbi:hypothetical protein CAP35_04330 [Chitinophagaceae bacterium IBVUCB1]|nr:hypothetical protein CAP35_04330 [Chitinophagaceae bacterium IBVUCB1]
MSHQHERSEKVCLNCHAALYDRFCHKCGQENVEPKQSFGQLIVHFFEDLLHFDGKFFTTIKYMIIKPGFVTNEYVNGRRANYVNPIRLYLFVSAAFFIISGMFFHSSPPANSSPVKNKTTDSANIISINPATLVGTKSDSSKIQTDTLAVVDLRKGSGFINDLNAYSKVSEYDSVQKSLPAYKKDNFIKHYFIRKITEAREYTHDNENFGEKFLYKFKKAIPAVLFFSLPLIALILQLLYIRKRKEYYYVSHIIFLIHYYCLMFLVILLMETFYTFGSIGAILSFFTFALSIFYLYKSMRGFYKQGRFKTFIKFSLLSILGITTLALLTLTAAINSILNIAH